MRRPPLRAFTVCGLGAFLFACAGCGGTKITPGGPRDFAPQTGSNIGRRLPLSTVQVMESAPEAGKAKRQTVKKEAKRGRADDDYITRGGFR